MEDIKKLQNKIKKLEKERDRFKSGLVFFAVCGDENLEKIANDYLSKKSLKKITDKDISEMKCGACSRSDHLDCSGWCGCSHKMSSAEKSKIRLALGSNRFKWYEQRGFFNKPPPIIAGSKLMNFFQVLKLWGDKRPEPKRNRDVHTEHCCTIHGCKYGEEDCTVIIGQKIQSWLCYDCMEIY